MQQSIQRNLPVGFETDTRRYEYRQQMRRFATACADSRIGRRKALACEIGAMNEKMLRQRGQCLGIAGLRRAAEHVRGLGNPATDFQLICVFELGGHLVPSGVVHSGERVCSTTSLRSAASTAAAQR